MWFYEALSRSTFSWCVIWHDGLYDVWCMMYVLLIVWYGCCIRPEHMLSTSRFVAVWLCACGFILFVIGRRWYCVRDSVLVTERSDMFDSPMVVVVRVLIIINNNNVCLLDWRHNAQSTVTSATQGGTRLYTEGLSSAKLLPHTAHSDW